MNSKSKKPMYLEVGDYVVVNHRVDATVWEVVYLDGWHAQIVDALLAFRINNAAPQDIDVSMLKVPSRVQMAKFDRDINYTQRRPGNGAPNGSESKRNENLYKMR